VLKILNGDSERISVNLKAYCKNTAGSLSSLSEKIKKRNDFQNDKLSVRELEVLDLIMQGYTNKEISEMLYLSHETIRSHRKNILRKTRQKNTASLINYYHQTFFDK
jgi:DNA-binding NarL/FixJ family response regulator